jgi:hypothetical protein
MIHKGQFSIGSIQSRTGRWVFESAVEPVDLSIKADSEETRQSANPQIMCESHRHSLFADGRQQQQEQCAGPIGVKTLSPKHTL